MPDKPSLDLRFSSKTMESFGQKKSHMPLVTLIATLAAVLCGIVLMLGNGGGAAVQGPKVAKTCKRGGFLGLQKRCTPVAAAAALPSPVGASPPPPSSSAASTAAKADSLMRRRSIDNCLAAADIYEEAAASTDGAVASSALKLKAADAINCAMRIKGAGNIMVLEGTIDTPERKKFWGAHGPRAYALVRAARAENAALRNDAAAAACEMDAFMYSSSAKGILRQAVTGAGTTFKGLAEELVAKYNSWDSAVGHCYLGGFFNVAPWPLGDKKRALAEFESSFAKDSRARRNGYYACLMRYQFGDFAGAVKACETALSTGRCDGPTTPDYCPFLTEQTQRLLGLAKKQL